MNPAHPAFDIKSASISGMALVLRSTDTDQIAAELSSRVRDAGDLFQHAPVLIDVSALAPEGAAEMLDLSLLIELLSGHTMRAVGIVGASGNMLAEATRLGLVEELEVRPRQRSRAAEPVNSAASSTAADMPVRREAGEAGATAPALVLDKPLRSGQRVYARGGDLVVLGMVSHGAEVIADGHIHVYGPLRGRAIAGAHGDIEARIFASAMEPELIAIAGTYRTTDKPLETEVLGRPAWARLDGDRLRILPLKN